MDGQAGVEECIEPENTLLGGIPPWMHVSKPTVLQMQCPPQTHSSLYCTVVRQALYSEQIYINVYMHI